MQRLKTALDSVYTRAQKDFYCQKLFHPDLFFVYSGPLFILIFFNKLERTVAAFYTTHRLEWPHIISNIFQIMIKNLIVTHLTISKFINIAGNN